jgi:triphosphoribosyl-dephospho-CoA synthase
VSELAARIGAAFAAACRDELEALKPGNVHNFADGHRMTAAQFVRSADAAAGPLTRVGARIGQRILGAVEATAAAVGANTNLGIILLCAPLAAAAEQQTCDIRAALLRRLAALDVEDARLAFRAIARASPGGLGRVERHDVHAPPTVSLRDAMAAAAHRDRIAHQYVTAFEDVFGTGQAALAVARARSLDRRWATVAVFLQLLAQFPDSHVARKHGAATAEEVRREAQRFQARFERVDPAHLASDFLAWDRELKARNINPGTSADLTVATLCAARLRDILPSPGNND